MSNSIASLIPILIYEESVPYLRSKGGFVKRAYSVREAEKQQGGQVTRLTLPASRFTPTNVDYTATATPQAITLPHVDITYDHQKEVVISLNDLEARIVQGNQIRVLRETMNAMIDGLIFQVESDFATAIVPQAGTTVGTYNSTLADLTIRQGLTQLMNNRISPLTNKVSLITTSKAYMTDLMGIDRYVLANNTGQGINPNFPNNANPVTGGKIPQLYNLDVDWSLAAPTTTTSGVGVAQNLLFEEYFAGIAFLDFIPVDVVSNGSAAITETFTQDPDSGITIRWQMYYDNDKRTMRLRCDCCYGYGVLDATRGILIQSKDDA